MDVAELSMFLDTLGMGKSDALGKDFEDAANSVKDMKNLDDAQKLQLYGLYKQSTVGDVQSSRPSLLDFAGAAKWDAWKGFSGMPKHNAALSYVYIVSSLLDPDESGAFSNFSDSGPTQGMGNIVSTLNSGVASEWADNLAIFKAIEDENMEELQKCLHMVDKNTDVNENALEKLSEEDKRNIMNVLGLRDPSGLTPLLFAADRGLVEMAKQLISSGADVDAIDEEGNTALMLSVVCEHLDMIKLLLENGANVNITNKSGESVLIMSDVSEEIEALLRGK